MLTNTLNTFVHAFSLRYSAIAGHASNLLKIFVLIELTLFGIYFALEGGEFLASIFKKILLIGAFQFLVSNFAWLVYVVSESFVLLGIAGSGERDYSKYLDPSWYISTGFDSVGPLWDNLSIGSTSFFTLGVAALTFFIVTIVIVVAYVLMGFQVFMTQLEFYGLTTLAIILLPFGLFRPTAFLADKVIGFVFSISIKMMILVFVASIAVPILKDLKVTKTQVTHTSVVHGLPVTEQVEGPLPLRETFMMAMTVLVVALLFRRAPTMAADLLSTSSNLDVGPIMRPLSRGVSAATQAAAAVKTGGVAAGAALMAKIAAGSAAQGGQTSASQAASSGKLASAAQPPKDGGKA